MAMEAGNGGGTGTGGPEDEESEMAEKLGGGGGTGGNCCCLAPVHTYIHIKCLGRDAYISSCCTRILQQDTTFTYTHIYKHSYTHV